MRFGLEGRFGAAAVAITVAARDRRPGWTAGAAAEGDVTLRRGVRQPVRLPVLRRGTGACAVFVVAAARRRRIGYTPCLMFAVCMALRLARFNASLDGAPRPAYAYNFFTGVPAPAGAGLALFPLFLGLEGEDAGLGLAARRCPASAVLRRACWSAPRCCWSPPCRSGASRTSRCRPNTCCRCCLGPALFAAAAGRRPVGSAGRRGADLPRRCCRSACAASAGCVARPSRRGKSSRLDAGTRPEAGAISGAGGGRWRASEPGMGPKRRRCRVRSSPRGSRPAGLKPFP